MSGFFKRLSRLARAEINSLGSRFSSRTDVNDADQELQDAIESAASEPTSPTWPPSIREAYAVLEIPLGSDEKTAKKAYRDLLNRYHPDKHQSTPEKLDAANEITMRVRNAYQQITDFLKDQRAKKKAD